MNQGRLLWVSLVIIVIKTRYVQINKGEKSKSQTFNNLGVSVDLSCGNDSQ